MKKTIGFFGLLALGAAVLFAPAPVQAACGGSVFFGQASLTCGGGYCYVISPGTNDNSSIQATFWTVGGGNPALGPGNDNGSLTDTSWLVSFGGPLALNGDWGATGVDGCADAQGTTGSMVVQLSDVSATNAFFAAACVTRNTAALFQFDQSLIVPAGNINLQPLPKPTITGSVRVGNEAQVTVSSPNFAPIYYSDGSPGCAINTVIPQYEVWVKQVGRNAAAPTDRDTTSGTWTLGNTCAIGGPCTVTTTCGTTNCDAYLAVSPKYNSGFQSGDGVGKARVGANSTRVQAGPVLAEPPDFKVIKKSTKDIKNR